jgi:molybdopterin/thiamine biosynthesis adenylyltransferase
MATLNSQAAAILVRELGVVDAMRFLSQFRFGTGDYTKDREQWLGKLSLQDIVSEIRENRQK